MILCPLVIGCSALVGVYLSRRMLQRKSVLRELIALLNRASVQIAYNAGSLCEIFSDNFAGFTFSYESPFDEQWQAFSDSLRNQLSRTDVSVLYRMKDGLGLSDSTSQQQHLHLCIELLEEQLKEAQSDIDSKLRLCRVLPVSAGLLFSILVM